MERKTLTDLFGSHPVTFEGKKKKLRRSSSVIKSPVKYAKKFSRESRINEIQLRLWRKRKGYQFRSFLDELKDYNPRKVRIPGLLKSRLLSKVPKSRVWSVTVWLTDLAPKFAVNLESSWLGLIANQLSSEGKVVIEELDQVKSIQVTLGLFKIVPELANLGLRVTSLILLNGVPVVYYLR